jgi:MHS family proline/betaine transporter-like MFS transporter
MLTKSIISSSIGNILEWYDFGLFVIYSTLFSQLFFPTEQPEIAFLNNLMVFAIGFICRPLGAILFGALGDKRGRATTLRFSILMISLPTLCNLSGGNRAYKISSDCYFICKQRR